MKSPFITLVLILLIFAAAVPARSQGGESPLGLAQAFNQDLQFDHLSTEDGLSGNTFEPADIVVLTDEQGQYPLGLHLEILEDESAALTIDDVTSPELDPKFVPSQDAAPNFGFSDSAFWVRFTVRNDTADTTD